MSSVSFKPQTRNFIFYTSSKVMTRFHPGILTLPLSLDKVKILLLHRNLYSLRQNYNITKKSSNILSNFNFIYFSSPFFFLIFFKKRKRKKERAKQVLSFSLSLSLYSSVQSRFWRVCICRRSTDSNSFALLVRNGSPLQRPVSGPLQEGDNTATAAAAINACQSSFNRSTVPTRPTRRPAHRFRPPDHRLRDLRRCLPHLHRQATHLRPQSRLAGSSLPGLARVAAIPHLHRRQQGQEGIRPQIAIRVGLQEESRVGTRFRFWSGEAEEANDCWGAYEDSNGGLGGCRFQSQKSSTQDRCWPGQLHFRVLISFPSLLHTDTHQLRVINVLLSY
jgi:hypothetical protein